MKIQSTNMCVGECVCFDFFRLEILYRCVCVYVYLCTYYHESNNTSKITIQANHNNNNKFSQFFTFAPIENLNPNL